MRPTPGVRVPRMAAFAAATLLLLGWTVAAQNLPQQGRIAGRVTSADGTPIGSARVGVIDESTAAMLVRETDAAGRFQAEGLHPGHRYRVVVARFGYTTRTLDRIVPGRNELAVQLTATGAAAARSSPAGNVPPPAAEAEAAPTFKVAVGLVTLNVSVKDASGAPVRGLTKSDFSVFEQGAPQEIAHFSEENTPASFVVLLDTSSSMEGPQIREAKRAALEFVEQSRPADELALVAFDDRIELLQPLTQERSGVRAAIDRLSARGGTALYDALAEGVALMRSARYPRRFVVVFSDGIDADSRRKFSDVERLVEASDVVVFAVGEYLGPERAQFMTGSRYYKEPALEVNYNPVWVLRQMSDVSGGAAFFPEAGQPLSGFFARIAREVQDQYVLGYVPPPPSPQSEFRKIEVKINPARPGVTVRTRKGYLSPGTGPLTRNR